MKRLRIIFLILIGVACVFGIIYALFVYKGIEIKKFDKEINVLVFTEYKDPGVDMCYGTISKCNKLEYEVHNGCVPTS